MKNGFLRFSPHTSAPKPFFCLADTAWRFLYCTDKEMAERYMRTRAEQGFTVFMLIAELVDSGRD